MTVDEVNGSIKVSKKDRVDPRFKRHSRKKSKIVVDERFKEMFTNPEFTTPVEMDRYGRRVIGSTDELDRFYESEALIGAVDHSVGASDTSSSSDEEEEDSEVENAAMDEALSCHPLVQQEGVKEVEQATRRLALVNADWDQIKAVDVYKLVHAFKPITGQIVSVRIFKSAFGKERLAIEAIEGPPRDIFEENSKDFIAMSSETDGLLEDEKSNGLVEDETYDGAFADEKYDGVEECKQTMEHQVNGDDDELEVSGSLKKYQLERLRYYYAVIECDSLETSQAIYSECDGNEFEASSTFLDLRFIPDDCQFDLEDCVDECLALPKTYRPKHDVVSDALHFTKAKLNWDNDDEERQFVTRSAMQSDAAAVDLAAYLASDDDEEEDSAEKYRALLGLSLSGKSVFGAVDEEDDGCREMSFTIEEDSRDSRDTRKSVDKKMVDKKMVDKKTADKKTADKKMVDKKMEKKQQKRSDRTENGKQMDQLALLIKDQDALDDEDVGTRKSKRTNDTSTVDLDDDRFKSLLEAPEFALDPTHPQFKKSAVTDRIIKERQRRAVHQ